MEKKITKDDMDKLPYIIAVDFDGTLVEDRFPEIGEPRQKVFADIMEAQKSGAKIILWTSRNGERLKEAVKYCASRGLHFDAINENLDECKLLFNNDTRKVYADEYWDDKAVAAYCSYKFSKHLFAARL